MLLNFLNPLWKYIAAFFSASTLVMAAVIWFQSHQIHRWHVQNDLCAEARQTDHDSYQAAQTKAKADNQAQVQQVEQKYQRNSTDEEQAYLSDLAQLRADNQRLRAQAPAPASPSGSASASQAPAPATGADGDGLHLSPDEHLQAQEIELRLMHLQDWVEKQLAVDPNK